MVLNGPSSAGKSTVGRIVQRALDPLPLYCELDHFIPMLPRIGHVWMRADERTNENVGGPDAPLRWVFPDAPDDPVPIELNDQAQRLVTGMHRSVAALAAAGNDVLVEHVLLDDRWKTHLAEALVGLDVAFVGFRCAPDVLRAREVERGNRVVGQAEAQRELVHLGMRYNLELDVTDLEAGKAAERIIDWLTSERGWARR